MTLGGRDPWDVPCRAGFDVRRQLARRRECRGRAPRARGNLPRTRRRSSTRLGSWSRPRPTPRRPVSAAHVQALRDALEGMHEARARLNDLVMADSDSQLLELHAAVLSTVKRILREMDLDQRIRRQVRLLPPTRPRLPHVGAPTPKAAQPFVPPTPPADAETQLLPKIPEDRRDNPRP